MPISSQGQLDLSSFEQVQGFQDCAASNGAGVTATIEADPADSTRSALQLHVPSTAASSASYVGYEFADDLAELWLEFEIRYTHNAAANEDSLVLLTLADESDVSIVKLLRITDSDTRWRSVNGSDGTFSTGVAKNAWERIRLRYKAASGGNNGILQAWRWNAGTNSYVSQVNITNNAATDLPRKFLLHCFAQDDLAGVYNSTVWFRGLTWGTQESHVGFKHRGLQFGHVCSTGDSSSTIDAMLFYRFARDYYGRTLGESQDPPDLAVQFQIQAQRGLDLEQLRLGDRAGSRCPG